MEKTVITFNDLPEGIAQLRDEVMGLKSLLAEQRSANNTKTMDTHVPMSVDEAAECYVFMIIILSPTHNINSIGLNSY